jgi:two-component system KDP operon response regulator KdpE
MCLSLVVVADPSLRAGIERELAAPPLPHAIVTDDVAGIAALRAAHPRTPIIAVAVGRARIAAALDAGADTAVAGPHRPDELRARLRAVARRREPPICVGALELDQYGRVARLDGAPLALSRREFDVLRCLASAPGHVLTKHELACRCWPGGAPAPSGRALERCISRLRARLGRHARTLVTVWGVGYRLGEPD